MLGMDPFRIETLWRRVYGTGYTLRPDISLMGVLSAIEMALWDIIGKAVDKPVYELLGGQVHERLRSYTYIYPRRPARTRAIYHDAELSAKRAAEYVKQGFTAVKFDPGGALFRLRSAPAVAGSAGRCRRSSCRLLREAVGTQGRSAVRHPRPVHRVRRHPAGQAARALRSAVVRGADAAGNAGGDGAGGARAPRFPIATGERL